MRKRVGRQRRPGSLRLVARIPIPRDLEVVFLDAGGVLVIPNMQFVIDSLHLPHTVEELLVAYSNSTDRISHHANEDERMLWIWEGVFDFLDHRLPPNAVSDFLHGLENQAWSLWFPANIAPQVHEQLPRLQDSGLELAVLSNADGTVEKAMEEAGVCQVGDGRGVTMKAVVDSGSVGMEKPDPRIFHHLVELTGSSPERVVHIGDSLLQDMHGAKSAGIAGVHLNRSGLCKDDEHYHAEDLEGAVDLLLDHVG
jgi:FMN phosphatase YigB (HAD superfamily)